MAIAQDANVALSNPTATPALGISALIVLLGRNLWTILAVLAVFLGLATAYLLVTEKKFTAEAKILLDPRDRRILATDTAPTGTGSDTALVESQLSLVTSDASLDRVIDVLKLTNDSEWVKESSVAAYQQTAAGQGADRATATRAVALDNLRKAVSVRRSERTYVVEIRAQSRDAGNAVKIASEIAKSYIAGQTEELRDRSRSVNEALTARLSGLREDLRAAENKLQNFRRENGLAGVQGSLISEQQLQEMSLRLVQAKARAAETKSKADNMSALARSGRLQDTSEALASETLKNLKTALAAARQREAELFPALGDNHPTLIEAREQVRALVGQVASEAARFANAAQAEADIAMRQERQLNAELEALRSNAQNVDAALIGQRELERNVASARQIYETFLNRAKETREREGIEAPSASLIAPAALVSPNPFPGRGLILGLAIIAGLGAGMALALVRAHLKNAVSNSGQARALTGGEVLSIRASRAARWWRPSSDTQRAVSRIASSSDLGVAARALSNELRSGPMRRSERLLTCLAPQDAADSAAIGLKLAEAVAVGGERVLLIDADAMSGALSKSLELDGVPGLSEVLQGEASIDATAVRVASLGIWVLGRGVGRMLRPAPDSSKLAQMLSGAAAQFDFVVTIPGPLLSDADALLISSASEQIVLAVREHETNADELMRAMRLLGRDRAKLHRTVMLTDGSATAV